MRRLTAVSAWSRGRSAYADTLRPNAAALDIALRGRGEPCRTCLLEGDETAGQLQHAEAVIGLLRPREHYRSSLLSCGAQHMLFTHS